MKHKIHKIAEQILFVAANSIDGCCYPSDVNSQGLELERALALLKFYGTILLYGEGTWPIFKINEKGQEFVNNGAWTDANYNEIVETREIAEKNNKDNKLISFLLKCSQFYSFISLLFELFILMLFLLKITISFHVFILPIFMSQTHLLCSSL